MPGLQQIEPCLRHLHLRLRHADARFRDAALIERGAILQIFQHLLRCRQFQLGVLLLIAHRLARGQRKSALIHDFLIASSSLSFCVWIA